MNKLMLMTTLVSSCVGTADSSNKLLKKGECYHTLGDLGGVPSEIFCAQSVGKDGFLKCKGVSTIDRMWQWYNCHEPETWKSFNVLYKSTLVKLDCPKQCPEP